MTGRLASRSWLRTACSPARSRLKPPICAQRRRRSSGQQLGANADFRVVREPQRVSLAGRESYATGVAGPSAVSGVVEIDIIYTTVTDDGQLFYLITMAPEDEFKIYEPAFDLIIASVRLGQ